MVHRYQRRKIVTNDWELDHVGIIVRDINTAIEYYQRINKELSTQTELKPFEGKLFKMDVARSAETSIQFKACFVQNNSVRIEFIEPLAGKNIFNDYLEKNGEGLVLLAFRVDDLRKEKARLVEAGIPVIASAKRSDGSDWEILFDTRESGNVIFALFSEPAPFPVFKPSDSKWKYHHLGLIVKDADRLAGYYQSIGFKLISPPREMVFTKLQGWAIYGRMPALPQKTKACQFQNKQGTFLLEVNEPAADGSLHREFLDQHGEGINHIHFLVDDLEKELWELESRGFPAIFTAKRPDGKLMDSFFETRKIGNVCISLWGGPPPFKTRPE
jgi:methylmalonyl-CoA/ethylmalonyl-CoA epimerase